MFKDKFENGFVALVIASLCMIGFIAYRDVKELEQREPEVKTVTEYVYLECDCEVEPVVEEVTEAPILEEEPIVEERASRGGDVILEPIIQPIDWNFDILTPSNLTSEQLSSALQTYPHSNLLPLVDVFVEAEKTYGINSLYLLATIGWESGWGRYRSNENNLAGWKDPSTGGFRYFNSEYECIMTVAAEVSTLWTQSVGSSLGNITSRYCPDPGYFNNITLIMSERQQNIIY